jgi:type IV pilus assembly protein PilA
LNRNRKQSGFSLIELLIVVAIILIIAAIAIPKLLAARNTASQANAAATMRSVNTAITMFNTNYGVFPVALSNLGGVSPCTPSITTGCALDDSIATLLNTGTYNNYVWAYATTTAPAGFTLTAVPAAGNGATRTYWLSEAGTSHYSDTGAAGASSPVLGN